MNTFSRTAPGVDGLSGAADVRTGSGRNPERTLPEILTRVEGLLAEARIPEEEIIVRMSGCPNGCRAAYMVGDCFCGQRAEQSTKIYLGGNEPARALNWVYKDSVKGEVC